MTNDRYIRLLDLKFDTYLLDCPVEIEKGALVLDKQTKSVLLQLRLNILDINFREISSVTLKIEAFDDAGEEIPDIKPFSYTFRDVNLLDAKSFGDRTPIVLDLKIRRVKVGIEKVTYIDGNVWRYVGGELKILDQHSINSLKPDLLEQINRYSFSLPPRNREGIIFIPQQYDNYWLCTCGRPNKDSVAMCCRCGLEKNWLFENFSEEGIQRNLDSYSESVRQLEEQKQKIEEKEREKIEENKARFKKRIGIIKKVAPFLIGISLLVVLFIFVALPFIKYNTASNLLNQKQYDQAILIFISLEDYKNSKEMVYEVNYQKANDLLLDKQFYESIAIFSKIDGYKDSKELKQEGYYQNAKALLSNKQYDLSMTIFYNLNDYKDSKELVREVYYQKANDLLSKKQYDAAITNFAIFKDYKNSGELYKEANYQKAKDLLDQKKFDLAVTTLSIIKDYKDSNELFVNANYLWGKQYFDAKKWANAKTVLEKIEKNKFPDLEEIINEANYNLAIEKASSGDYKAAYYLVEKLNYKNSTELASQYGKIAFAWRIEGGMTKSSYNHSEHFKADFTVFGGKPSETINLLVVCTLPGAISTGGQAINDVRDTSAYSYGCFYEVLNQIVSGIGNITIINSSTGEVLRKFDFSIN